MAGKPITLDHIPEDHLRGIGLVALSWSFLEGAVERVIWRAARLNDGRGASMTTHMSMPMRLQAMRSLVNLEFPGSEIAKQINEIATRISGELTALRNEIVHNRIIKLPEIDATLRTQTKARGELQKTVIKVDEEVYQQASDKILEAASNLRHLLWNLIKVIEEKDGTAPP